MLDEQMQMEGCPPHHWVIQNELTDQQSIERWSCQRCGATRERTTARRRALLAQPKRYVGEAAGGLGRSGERVA